MSTRTCTLYNAKDGDISSFISEQGSKSVNITLQTLESSDDDKSCSCTMSWSRLEIPSRPHWRSDDPGNCSWTIGHWMIWNAHRKKCFPSPMFRSTFYRPPSHVFARPAASSWYLDRIRGSKFLATAIRHSCRP